MNKDDVIRQMKAGKIEFPAWPFPLAYLDGACRVCGYSWSLEYDQESQEYRILVADLGHTYPNMTKAVMGGLQMLYVVLEEDGYLESAE